MRKIGSNLLDEMINGDLSLLLNYVKSHNDLRLEVRTNGDAFIYFCKGVALKIKSLSIDSKYGYVSPSASNKDFVKENPGEYFKLVKKAICSWLKAKGRGEFDTQQNIARDNQEINDKYIILDMEYAFEQQEIIEEKDERGEKKEKNREKRAIFDLLGIERKTNRIVFFEVKKGMGATRGNSGIEEHIADFKNYISGKNKQIFRDNLIRDIKNIISDKTELGILNNYSLPENFGEQEPELVFVFHPDNPSQVQRFTDELKGRHSLIIVSDSNYKLK